MRRIRKILIANRGEIAYRVLKAAQKLGIKAVNVASEADKNAFFAREAEDLVILRGKSGLETYLNQDLLISIAKEKGCDAIHPGYGFLSENWEFAKKVSNSGLIFIGPSYESIRDLGSKTKARELAVKSGVPVVPGCRGGLTDDEIRQEAQSVGYPLIIKAVGGGGGRGMRIVRGEDELRTNLPLARSEAQKNFGNADVYIERFIENPRHVEVQIFGDNYGNVIHLGTRDCSTQRRHQKLIEEAPAPYIDDDTREGLHSSAVKLARSIGYKGAGTAEFLVKDGEYFFLEMNTRIQVEHPVTEVVTDLDLVALQMLVAEGYRLFKQSDVHFRGHAIEFRINAEDPEDHFKPVTGRIEELSKPNKEFVRYDFGFSDGDEITSFYDSMIGKVIVFAPDRQRCINRSIYCLRDMRIGGIKTTIPFHLWALYTRDFREKGFDIGYVEREFYTHNDVLTFVAKANELKGEDSLAWVQAGEKLFCLDCGGCSTLVRVYEREDNSYVVAPFDEDSGSRWEHCTASNDLNTALSLLKSKIIKQVMNQM